MDSRSYIKLTGNLTNITGTTGSTYTGTTPTLYINPTLTKRINLGYWNMDSNSNTTKNVSTGVPLSKVINVDAIIISDGGELFKIEKSSSNWESAGYVKVCNAPTTNAVVSVTHNDAGSSFFRQTGFNSGSINRGWVVLTYSGIQKPSGTTGTVAGLTSTSFSVNNNKVIHDGGSPICQYGVVWSTNPTPTLSNGTPFFTTAPIGVNVPYSKTLSPVPDSSTIYFRQYAKNCEETGYGNICSVVTPAVPPTTTTQYEIYECYGNTTPQHKDGLITLTPPLTSASQCVTIHINYHQLAQNSGDVACIQILKSCNGGSYYYEYPFTPPAYTTYYGEGGINQYEGNGTGSIVLRKGDCICWVNDISGYGYFGQLRSDFQINTIPSEDCNVTSYAGMIHTELP
jgi:hypothetical protein